MSGLEFLFMDGGATVATGISAVAGWMGIQGFVQRQRDDATELVEDADELKQLLQDLQAANGALKTGHEHLSNTWKKQPLSLFGPRDEAAAAQRGVPDWAINCAHKARRLAEEAASLGAHADDYETQLRMIYREGLIARFVEREPVRRLIAQIRDLEPKLVAQTQFLREARTAFETASGEGATTGEYLTFEEKAVLQRSISAELPETVLRKKGRWGLALQQIGTWMLERPHRDNVSSVIQDQVEAASTLVVTEAREQIQSRLHSADWAVRRQAAEHLGYLRDVAAVSDLCSVLRDDPCDNVREVAAISLGLLKDAAAVPELCEALQDPWLRYTAAESLQMIGQPRTAPLIFAAQQNNEAALMSLLAEFRNFQKDEP